MSYKALYEMEARAIRAEREIESLRAELHGYAAKTFTAENDRDSWRRVAERIEREKLQALRERDEARQECAALLKVLRRYANESLYTRDKQGWIIALLDKGQDARDALAQYDTAQPTAQGEG